LSLSYVHYVVGGIPDHLTYPRLPWSYIASSKSSDKQKLEYNGKVVLTWPAGTLYTKIDSDTETFFLNLIRLDKLSRI
jgi:hypothetical protein